MNLATLLSLRYVYVADVLPGRVLRARAVSTGDLFRAGVEARLVMHSPVVPQSGGPNLAPPPASLDGAREELAAFDRVRVAALRVDGSWATPEGWTMPENWPPPDLEWEPFALVPTEDEEHIEAGRLWADRLGGMLILIGQSVLRESAGAQGVARALTTFPRG